VTRPRSPTIWPGSRPCAKPDVRDLLTVFVGIGPRYAELAALQVRDVDLLARPSSQSRDWGSSTSGRFVLVTR
jgi:hypothetical protein